MIMENTGPHSPGTLPMQGPTASASLPRQLDRQVETLLARGYPIRPYMADLREKMTGLALPSIDIQAGTLPFVVVVKSTLVPADVMMSRVDRDGRTGVTKLFPHEPPDFSAIDSVALPDSDVYLLLDIDRGKANINLPPDGALAQITAAGRSPLTIDEGIAIVTHYPDFLMKNNCFSLAGSRCPGDRRVPAIWISRSRQPNLGWCWAGNPHTWLGTASCARRL
jgi:hypothetical protein